MPKEGFCGTVYYIAAFFMPSILLFHLYNQNRFQNHLVFGHVLIFAGIFAVAGLLVFFAFKLAAGNGEGALLLAVLFWLCFWLFQRLFGVAIRFFALTPIAFMVLLGAALVFIVVLFRRYEPPFVKIRPAFSTLAISLIALFAFNLIPGASHNLGLQRARIEMTALNANGRPYYIKRNFNIDPALPSPNILWIHVDGMMSAETVERFWGVPQEHLREELVRRGFLIYKDAQLYGGATLPAVPKLLSPAFYDSFFGGMLADIRARHPGVITNISELITDRLAQVGLAFHNILEHPELTMAFFAREYEFEILDFSTLSHPSLYLTTERIFSSGDLLELLTLATPLNFPPHLLERVVVTQSYDFDPLARFTWRALYYTHVHYVWHFHPDWKEYHHLHPSEIPHEAVYEAYPLAYEHMVQRMLYYIDTMLEEDPNAVIILQSDHAFHNPWLSLWLLNNQGYTIDEFLELRYSVFSAMRIPPQYGGLDVPIAPLNISRELVNRFVGQNYNLLPSVSRLSLPMPRLLPSVPGVERPFFPLELHFGHGSVVLRYGFSWPEGTHTWTIQERARVEIPISPTEKDLRVIINGRTFLPTQTVNVIVNDRMVGLIMGRGEFGASEFIIQADDLHDKSYLDVELVVSRVYSPSELGWGDDTRTLGFALSSISISEL